MKKNKSTNMAWQSYIFYLICIFVCIFIFTFVLGFSVLIIIEKYLIKFDNKNYLFYLVPIGISVFSISSWFLVKSHFGVLIIDKLWVLDNKKILKIKHLNMYVEIKNKIKNECKEYNFDI